VESRVKRSVQPVRRAKAPKYPTLAVAWRILAATMPLVPCAAYADATVPGEHQPVKPGKPSQDVPPPPMPGAPPPPEPPRPPQPKGVRAPRQADPPPRLPGK
jgi:hypothetical protein